MRCIFVHVFVCVVRVHVGVGVGVHIDYHSIVYFQSIRSFQTPLAKCSHSLDVSFILSIDSLPILAVLFL